MINKINKLSKSEFVKFFAIYSKMQDGLRKNYTIKNLLVILKNYPQKYLIFLKLLQRKNN